ncbi:hypothetical protein F4823DRAFT_422484 [Ustulina deusta]|nr:hypothetical protein F4823DRAFT_422484 [Ustulina deusta]
MKNKPTVRIRTVTLPVLGAACFKYTKYTLSFFSLVEYTDTISPTTGENQGLRRICLLRRKRTTNHNVTTCHAQYNRSLPLCQCASPPLISERSKKANRQIPTNASSLLDVTSHQLSQSKLGYYNTYRHETRRNRRPHRHLSLSHSVAVRSSDL